MTIPTYLIFYSAMQAKIKSRLLLTAWDEATTRVGLATSLSHTSQALLNTSDLVLQSEPIAE